MLIEKGCLHPIDKAAVTVAVYSGLRFGIRPRPPYQTRHTYACWNLTARGNLAFIANQMGHKDYSMLVTVYGRWIDSESRSELDRIWTTMQNMVQIAPNLPKNGNE